jgi:hypothetical protein
MDQSGMGDAPPRQMTHTSKPADPERHEASVAQSQPEGSTWAWEHPYVGPPEDGQPRAGSACASSDETPRESEENLRETERETSPEGLRVIEVVYPAQR